MSYINGMHSLNDEYQEEKFSSFLGGILLTRKTITNLEFFRLLEEFRNTYNIDITDSKFIVRLDTRGNSITLLDDYEDIIIYNNKKITVRDYLYSVTSSNVREFFNLDCDVRRMLKLKAFMRK